MDQDYWKFLNVKLYLIEQISLKEMLNGNEKMKEIHDICLAKFSDIEQRLNNLSLHKVQEKVDI